jgi:hypothetical protein
MKEPRRKAEREGGRYGSIKQVDEPEKGGYGDHDNEHPASPFDDAREARNFAVEDDAAADEAGEHEGHERVPERPRVEKRPPPSARGERRAGRAADPSRRRSKEDAGVNKYERSP